MTADPQAAPAPAAAVPAATSTEPAATATDPAAEIARLQAELDQWKGHSRGWEAKAKANLDAAQQAAQRDEQLAKVAQALGIEGPKPDPEAIARQLAASQAEAAQRARELAVLRAAQSAGADGDALLDSRAFLREIESIDPNDPNAVRAAVTAAVTSNPKFAVAPPSPATPAAPPPRQASTAGNFNAQPGAARQLGMDDFNRMTPAERSDAMRKGLFQDYLNS